MGEVGGPIAQRAGVTHWTATMIVGETLLRQFRVDAFIASGGMGSVYRVWDLKRNVPLAMKVLHAELAEDPSVFKRFQRQGPPPAWRGGPGLPQGARQRPRLRPCARSGAL